MAKKFKKNIVVSNDNNTENNTNNEALLENEGSIFGDNTHEQEVLKAIEETLEEGSYRERAQTISAEEIDEGANAKVFEETKNETIKVEEKLNISKKAKKPKKTYEHTTWSHKMRVLSVLLVVGIFSGSGLGVWYFNTQLRSNFNPFAFNAEDYIQSVNETFVANNINATEADGTGWVIKAQSQGLTPADLTPADNFILAAFNTSKAKSYIIDGEGYVDANAMGIPARQSIQSRKKYNGSYYTFESISPSNFKGLGLPDIVLCDKYSGGNTLDLYTSQSLTPTSEDWTHSQNMAKEDYLIQSGSLPKEITPYIISAKTVSVDTNTKDSIIYDDVNETYTYTMSLDNQTSVINYSKQVKRTGGLGGYPEFEYINFTVTIDSNWNLKSFIIEERYSALKGVKAICTGVLNYIVTINGNVEMPV